MTQAPPFISPDGTPLLHIDDAQGDKAAGDSPGTGVLARSVTGVAPGTGGAPIGGTFLMWYVTEAAGAFVPWGQAPKARDVQLRTFWPTENLLASALSTVVARNAAMSWKITGDEQTAEAAQALLANANYGAGWEDFIATLSIDLYTQDTGAFVEFIRAADSPTSPVIGIAHLDSARCYPTGNPDTPVIYEDSNGKFHRMPWYSVVQLLEIPSPITPSFGGFFYRAQYCAVTRALRAAQVLKAVAQYKEEKVEGRFMRALHLISGVSEDAVRDAMARATSLADAQGLTRYMAPAIVGSVDPQAAIKHDTIEMASLPDGWSEKESMELYILALSLAFLTDYQEFAPLPGGGLGTANQSQILHEKARGRGPGLFQKMIARLMNLHGALPANVQFEWDEQDISAEQLVAATQLTRAQARVARIRGGEIDAMTAQQIALREGDLTQEEFDELKQREEERARLAAEQMQQQADAAAAQVAGAGGQQSTVGGNGATPRDGSTVTGGTDRTPATDRQTGSRSLAIALDPGETPEDYGYFAEGLRAADGGVPFGNLISGRLHSAYAMAADGAHSLGYFSTTDERKLVGAAIGPALTVFEDALREAGVWDITIGPEDADRIVDLGMKALAEGTRAESASTAVADNPRRADVKNPIDQERLDYEAEVGVEIAKGLAAARRVVSQYLRGQRDVEAESDAAAEVAEEAVVPTQLALPVAVGTVREVERTPVGYRIYERPLREGERAMEPEAEGAGNATGSTESG